MRVEWKALMIDLIYSAGGVLRWSCERAAGTRKQICIIEPGGFHTNGPGMKGAVVLPQHPAYADKSFAGSVLRQMLEGVVFEGDAEKFTRTVYEVVQGGKIPKRLPMGLDALEMLNLRIENLKMTV